MSSADFHGGDRDVVYSEYDSKRQTDIFRFQLFFMRFMGQVPIALDRYLPKYLHWLGSALTKTYCGFCVVSNFHLAALFLKTTYDMLQHGQLEEITDALTLTIIYCFSNFATCYCWYPFDPLQPMIYEIVYTIQLRCQFLMGCIFGNGSAVFVSISVIMLGQFDVLYCSLKNLDYHAHIIVGRGLNELRYEQKQLPQSSDVEINQYITSMEHLIDLDDENNTRGIRSYA